MSIPFAATLAFYVSVAYSWRGPLSMKPVLSPWARPSPPLAPTGGQRGGGGGRGIQSSRRGTERLPFAGVSVSSEDSPQHTQNPGVGLLPSVARLVQHLTASDTGSRRQLISQQQLPAPAALPRKQSPADHLAVFWVAQKSQ